jgi:hypothetical protein
VVVGMLRWISYRKIRAAATASEQTLHWCWPLSRTIAVKVLVLVQDRFNFLLLFFGHVSRVVIKNFDPFLFGNLDAL